MAKIAEPQLSFRDFAVEVVAPSPFDIELPVEDNTSGGLRALLAANAHYRNTPWAPPYGETNHEVRLGDARDLSWAADKSVHLIVTSPPYWTLKRFKEDNAGQMGDIEDTESPISPARSSRTMWSTSCSYGRADNIAP